MYNKDLKGVSCNIMVEILILLFLLCLSEGIVYADTIHEGECGENAVWSFDDQGTLTISGEGEMYDYSTTSEAPWGIYKDSIKEVKLDDEITSIGLRAFEGCISIENIQLPDELRIIQSYAFLGCSSLSSIVIPAKVGINMERGIFNSCNSLEYITLLNGMSSRGQYSLYYYTGTIYYPEDSEHWNDESKEDVAPNAEWIPVRLDPITLDSGTCGDGVTWELNNLGVLRISGEGEMQDRPNWYTDQPWRHQIKRVVIDEGVTSIGSEAFSKNISRQMTTFMTSIQIPDSLTVIGGSAFEDTSISEITIPENVEIIGGAAFKDCLSLREVTLGRKVRTIGSRAFQNCKSLENIMIPDSVRTIEKRAFYSCESLKSITLPENICETGTNLFEGCNSLETINIRFPASAGFRCAAPGFEGTVYYPANDEFWDEEARNTWAPDATWIPKHDNDIEVTEIDNGDCGENASWTISNQGVLIISGTGSITDFNNENETPWHDYKSRIRKVVINDGITTIGAYAFNDCKYADVFDLPSSIISIGQGSFLSAGIKSFDSDNVKQIGDYAFNNCQQLTTVRLGGEISTINRDAFWNCTSLREISLPDSITFIAQGAFRGCASIESINLPDELRGIGRYAFMDCTSLNSIVIPARVRDMQEDIFDNCTSLEYVTLLTGMSTRYFVLTNFNDFSGTMYYPADSEHWTDEHKEAVAPNAYWCAVEMDPVVLESGTCGENVTWELNNLGVLKITGEGEIQDKPDWHRNNEPWWQQVKKVIIDEGTTRIGEKAFNTAGSRSITSVHIPNSVTEIGSEAFRETSISEITIPENVIAIEGSMFYDCLSLRKVSLGNKVKTIGLNAFHNCKSLEDIELPDSVKSIGRDAFSSCESLNNITLTKNISQIGENLFDGCDSLETINIKCPAPMDISCAAPGFNGTVYYPANDEFWDEEARNIWAPDATWVPRHENDIEEAYIDSGDCGDDATWKLSNQSVLIISGTGPVDDYKNYNEIPWYTYSSKIRKVVVDNGITRIGSYAFNDFRRIEHVDLGDSVRSIGRYAFSLCTSLSSIDLPESVESLDENAFMMSGLKEVTITENLTSFGGHAFWTSTFASDSLEKIIYKGSYDKWCRINFSYEGTNPLKYTSARLITDDMENVELSEGVKVIPAGTFRGNTRLRSIILPKSLEKVEDDAFLGCDDLKEVEVYDLSKWCNIDFTSNYSNPLTVSSDVMLQIGGGTGSKVTIAEGVKRIPDRTFSQWDMLNTVTLPSSIESIGSGAFAGCTGLRTVNISDLAVWLGISFETRESSPLFYGEAELRLQSGNSYDSLDDPPLDRTVSTIPLYAFSGSKNMRTIIIPEGITAIGTGAFSYCSNLSSVIIPETVTALEDKTFYGCSALKKIYIPDTITRIEYDAFDNVNENLTIYGSKGSTAEEYASAKDITFRDYSEYDDIRTGTISDDIRWIFTGGTTLTIEGQGEIADFSDGDSPFAAFKDSVTTVKIKGITGIGNYVFQDFTNLKQIDVGFDSDIERIGPLAFLGCNDLSIRCYSNSYNRVSEIVSGSDFQGITVIKLSGSKVGNVFWSYNEYTGTIILNGNGSTSFGESFTESPFIDVDAKNVVFSDDFSCREIPDNLFKDCNTIKEIHLPEKLTSIGANAFSGCVNLEQLTWYGNIETIGEGAFYNCSRLQKISLSDSEMIDENGNETADITIEIPDSVKQIPDQCFMNCVSIKTVDWYEGTGADGRIGANAFMNCSSLSSINIPEHIALIDSQAFCGCVKLGNLFFGSGLKQIKTKAFFGCKSMYRLTFENDLQEAGDKSFGYDDSNKVPGFIVGAPDSATVIKNYCADNELEFITTDGADGGSAQGDYKVDLKTQNITVKKNKSKTIKFSTDGRVTRIKGTTKEVSVTRAGNKVKLKGLRTGKHKVEITFDMAVGKDVKKNVTVTVRKDSASINGGEEQRISADTDTLVFDSDAAKSRVITVTGVETTLHQELSVDGIVKAVISGKEVSITPVKSGSVTLTLYAAGDDVYSESNRITLSIKVKARPKKVTAKVKKLSKRKARVTWDRIPGASSYQIQVAAKKNFKGKKTYKVKSGVLKKTVKIKKGKKNYIRIRYICRGKYSRWSKIFTVKK